jgi:hypothetical protein
MMNNIKDIFINYGQMYIDKFSDKIPKDHIKVIYAIMNCRTEVYGSVFYKCEGCGKIHGTYRSCGNRHCPSCQNHKTKLWVLKQIKRELPGNHFMLTFTVPSEIRNFIRSNQRISYSSLFLASSMSMKKMITDKRFMGGDTPGFWGVLHTWGRQLQYHPHIHYVVTGGALDKKFPQWNKSRKDFYLPVRALSKIYKAKFKNEINKAGLLHLIPAEAWSKEWNVNCQAVGSGRNSLKYLSRYVFKVAISDSRIMKVEDDKVYISYKKKGSTISSMMVLDIFEFLRRFLQNVLPSGFMKIRYYGFLHPSFSIPLEDLKKLMEEVLKVKMKPLEKVVSQKLKIKCNSCGEVLKFIYSILPGNIRIVGTGFT